MLAFWDEATESWFVFHAMKPKSGTGCGTGILPLLWASTQPPADVSQSFVASGVGRPFATCTWTGSPSSPDQKNMRYPPIEKRLGNV